MRILSKLLLLFLVALPCVLVLFGEGQVFARAEDQTEEDIIGDDDEAVVEGGGESDEEVDSPSDELDKIQGSPDIDLQLLFTYPEGNGMELLAGKPVEFLIGVSNNGDREFIVDAADVSFKYPMDFTYTIQNFSTAVYSKSVKPQQETTVFYNFFLSENFAGRPLGLQINLAYHDAEGEDFVESVFNSTVNIIEVDEGLDGETFFVYVFLFAFAVLLLLAGHHLLTSLGIGGGKKSSSKSKSSSSQPSVEVGTVTKNGVDFEWLPDHMKAELRKQAAASATTNGTSASKRSKGGKDLPPKGAPASVAKGVATRSSPRLRKT